MLSANTRRFSMFGPYPRFMRITESCEDDKTIEHLIEMYPVGQHAPSISHVKGGHCQVYVAHDLTKVSSLMDAAITDQTIPSHRNSHQKPHTQPNREPKELTAKDTAFLG